MNTSDEESLSKCLLTPDNKNLLRFSLECFYEKMSTDYYFLFLSCLFVFFIIVDVALNFVLLSSIFIEKFKTRVDICFMSNAFADLLMGLIIMPFTAIYTLFGHFPFSPYVCFLWNCLDFTTGTTSMLHLALISFDRYLSVSKPLKYTNKQRADNRFSVHGLPTSLILIFIWFFSCTAWIPVLLYFKSTSLHEPQLINECGMAGSPLIIVPHSLFVYYIPMFLIVYFYTKTIVIVNQKLKRPVKNHVQQSQSAAQRSRFCCIVKYMEPRKESIRLHEAKTDTDFSKLSRSDTTINNLRPVNRSASLELNLNKSLENSKHLNQLYQLHQPLNRTYHSSINFSMDGADHTSIQKAEVKKPNSGADLASMVKNVRVESKQKFRHPRPKFKLSITSSFSRGIVVNKEKSVTYKLGVIMVTFIVSWAPFCVLWSLVSLCNKWPSMCFVSDNLYIVSFWLAYFNSIFTPLILLYNNQKYRKSVFVFTNYLSRKTASNSSNQLSAAGRRPKAINCPSANRVEEKKFSINNCTYTDKDLLFSQRANPT